MKNTTEEIAKFITALIQVIIGGFAVYVLYLLFKLIITL